MFADIAAQATVAVRDLEKARAFYEGVLGLSPLPGRPPGLAAYRTGSTVMLVYQSTFAGTNRATSVTWSLGPRFDEAVAALKAKGVAFEHYDMPGGRREGDVHIMGQMRIAWFKDPDGNIINIGNYEEPRL